jgi:hypothetical protein
MASTQSLSAWQVSREGFGVSNADEPGLVQAAPKRTIDSNVIVAKLLLGFWWKFIIYL